VNIDAPDTLNVKEFIKNTEFTGYQRIVLPSGQIIPGTNRLPLAELIFPTNFESKTVLDVGCYYGYFLHEAIRRGAGRAVGFEADAERYRISSSLAQLWDDKVEIVQGLLEEIEYSEKFDYVFFLNVLHHVKDPLDVMQKLAKLCRGTLVVEFRQLNDQQFIYECFHKPGEVEVNTIPRSIPLKALHRLKLKAQSKLVELLTRNMPLVGVGSVEYDRSFYFSQLGFKNMFQVHNKLFKSVQFRPSLTPGQVLAFCDCSE